MEEKKSEEYINNLKKEISSFSKTEIISSDQTGVGKSTQIKLDIRKLGKKCVYFPIGGNITKLDIIQRLKCLKLDNNTAIHLDLYDTEQKEFDGRTSSFIISNKNI